MILNRPPCNVTWRSVIFSYYKACTTLLCLSPLFLLFVWKNTTTSYCEKSHPNRYEAFYETDHSPAPNPLCGAVHGWTCTAPILP